MLNLKLTPTFKRIAVVYLGLLAWLATSAMHIPDGYLSPVTSLVMFLLVLPFWALGIRKIRQSMDAKSIPLIALMAAFSFVIMMFNVPLPGGTSGHAVGAALAAVVLGPEIATIAVSIALIIQAVFFGDGGILAIGANCFNMAVIIPYLSFALYQALTKNSPAQSPWRLTAAGISGWVGLTVGALFTGFEFGLQPLLFKAADGSPLYAPYSMAVAIPAMVIPHMLVASVVEGVMTALVFAFLQRSNIQLLTAAQKRSSGQNNWNLRWVWAGLGILVVASPLGLLAPGTAWGEWGLTELQKMGFTSVPAGLHQLSSLWGAPLAGYDLPALGNANLGYVLSAALGIAIIGVVVWLFTMLLTAGRAVEARVSRQDRSRHG